MSNPIGYLLFYCITNVKYRYKGKHLFLSNKEKTIIFLKNHFFNIEKTLFYKLIMYLCKVI